MKSQHGKRIPRQPTSINLIAIRIWKMILTEISLWLKMILTEISLWLKIILTERVFKEAMRGFVILDTISSLLLTLSVNNISSQREGLCL